MAATMGLSDIRRHAFTFLVLYIAIPTLLAFTAWIYGLMGTCGDVCYEVVSEAGFAGVKDYLTDGKPTIARCELCVQRNWDADFHKNIGVPFVVAFLMIYVIRNKAQTKKPVAKTKKPVVTESKKKK
mmetsp:Transcript_7502/g.13559  ORF Transcript_7502/g.13559 Transcript_7502/m.13559 type:complete len:127 (+) Transcript_7502:50-430(+)